MVVYYMAVKTKSIFQPAEDDDGVRVLITRFYPRGVKKTHFDYWVRELSPSKELLQSYKEGIVTWAQFKVNLLSEIRENKDSLDALYALNDHSQSEHVTLLCYEKAGNPCHRHLVRDLVADPNLLSCHFEPKDTDDHEGVPVDVLVSNEKALLPSRIV